MNITHFDYFVKYPMRNMQITVLILLLVVLGLLLYIRAQDVENVPDVQDGQIEHLEQLELVFLDIGQGDATFVTFPDGSQMLIDCAIDARIMEALGRHMDFYDKTIDYLLVTHPDLDHYGGCIDVMKRFDIGTIVYNGFEKPHDDMWQEFMMTVEEEKAGGAAYVIADTQHVWDIAGTRVQFLYPDHSVIVDASIPGVNKKPESNNTSIVLKMSYGEQDILLMADAEEELEEYLVATYGDQLDVEVLKAGHHGSGTSSIEPFLAAATPDIVSISSGRENRFGHPSRRVLRRLERAGSEIFRTDLDGDIRVLLREDVIEVVQ